MSLNPDITFIIPFYNEESFLGRMLKSLEIQNLDKIIIEVILVDGKSSDKSCKVISDFISNSLNKNVHYKILPNEKRKTSYGFNLGIKYANANIIGFGGAHCIYPDDLFKNVIDIFKNIDADVIGGGHKNMIPDKTGIFSKALSALYVSPFGAGVAAYHRKSKAGYVDTVFGGFYKRSIFEDIGNFDNNLDRGQDFELNARIKKAGYKIYFDPKLNNDYIIKTNAFYYMKRAFNTGRSLPKAWFMDINNFSLRHFIPFCFFVYILILITAQLLGYDILIIKIPFILYCISILFSSLWLIFTKNFGFSGILTIPIFFLYHLTYGLGTMIGLFKNVKIKL